MTTYNWNYNQLKVLKKEYLKLLFIDRTLSHDDKEGISVQINSINEMLNLKHFFLSLNIVLLLMNIVVFLNKFVD